MTSNYIKKVCKSINQRDESFGDSTFYSISVTIGHGIVNAVMTKRYDEADELETGNYTSSDDD